jgi:Tetratricopeptide repeat
VGAHPHARGGAAFIAIPVDTVVRSGRLRSPMKLKTPSSFVAVVCVIVMLLAAGLSSVGSGQPAAQEESPAELNQRIPKLYQQGKYEEAIPLAEKLVVLTRRAKGEEDPDTAASLSWQGELYQAIGDYTRAELLLKESLEIRQKVLGQCCNFAGVV